MNRTSLRALAVSGVATSVLALGACGGGGVGTASAGAARTTAPPATSGPTTTTPVKGSTPANGSAPAGRRGGFGGGQFAQMAQAFTQCLRSQGLEVGDLQPGARRGQNGQNGQNGTPPNGSRPRFQRPQGSIPQGGSVPPRPQLDPAQMAQRFAQRLGLDMSNAAVAAAVNACSSQLG